MNTFSSFRAVGLALGISCSLATLVSCSSSLSPKRAAAQVKEQGNSVFSYNDQATASDRECLEMGALPDRARRALSEWMKNSTLQPFSYIYPQYYVTIQKRNSPGFNSWAICTDAKGNVVGILVPRGNVQAWDLPNSGNYKLYVCSEDQRADLSRAILEALDAQGMDDFRLASRKGAGLTEAKHLISAPAPAAIISAPAKKAAAPTAAPVEEAPVEEEEEVVEETEDSFEDSDSDDEFGF